MELMALVHTLYLNEGLGKSIRKVPPPIKQTEQEVDQYSDEEETAENNQN